ncbi:hypothetical protein PPGU19_011690 [Paraburkholderia sp. PGU19]|nr:hypothetical protein PPGU19_011690 [Paraburkholderia sp. PGU19]
MKTELTPKDILQKPYARRLLPDEIGGYTATILEFPGCIAEGDTAQEALAALEEAAESWLTVAIANKNEIREPVDFEGYSGKVALRIPRTLHRQVAEFAEMEGTSINQLLVHAISRYVGGKEAFRAIADKLIDSFPKYHVISINVANIQQPKDFHLSSTALTAQKMLPLPRMIDAQAMAQAKPIAQEIIHAR